MHSRKLHLLLADPSLTDYQHVHPEPTKVAGEWSFVFTPKHGGIYRIFADFTPTATNRSLYSNVDLVVAGGQLSDVELAAAMQQARNQGAATIVVTAGARRNDGEAASLPQLHLCNWGRSNQL